MGLFINRANWFCLNTFLNKFGVKKVNIAKVNVVYLVLVTLLVFVPFSHSYGLGMGAATVDSYIGERLSIHIPIFNVKKPGKLELLLQRSESDSSIIPLDAAVERSNSQLGVRITSEQQTSEPYISFVLDVIDDGDVTSREFTVLLDLAQGNLRSAQPDQRANNDLVRASIVRSNESNVSSLGNGVLMGPYEWAEAGRVADSFGPVLDGQSLWRVARRINKALGVSVDQMMWSLYQNNRDQFSSDSISSLRAGAILKIPTAQQASQISELQAKANIESSRLSRPINSSTESSAVSPKTENLGIQKSVEEPVDDAQSFQLTGLDSSNDENGLGLLSTTDEQSKDVIASLAEAVGSLTQELIKKDRKISFLEEKVAALEAYAKVSASDLPDAAGDDFVVDPSVQLDTPLNTPLGADRSSELELNAVQKNNLVEPVKEVITKSAGFKPWYWLLILVALLLLVALLFRKQLIELTSSLNLFRSEDKIEFDPSEYHSSAEGFNVPSVDSVDGVDGSEKFDGLSQESILDAIKNAVQVEDPLSPQTLMDLDGEFSYTEMLSENKDSLSDDDANLTFIERFNQALSKHDYGFALQLLNMAKGNEINQGNYHYQRLRMYELMHDEDAFYDYFCEIENDIPSFEMEIQTKISQLVLQMAQQ